jgi:translation initiation factor 2 gamma subunit (eIF-2gamma)
VLIEVRAGRMPEPYARVMSVDSEVSLGTAHDEVSGQQPPPTRAAVAGRVDDLLTRADTLVGAGREALVAGELAAVPRLADRLDRLGTRLTAEMKRRRG